MFGSKSILIVEDEPLIAMALADAVKGLDGLVIGPIATVSEALDFLDCHEIAGAILDARLLDAEITPVALRLARAGIPVVVHSGTGLPAEVAAEWPGLPLLMKPTSPEVVARRLLIEMTGKQR